MFLKEAWVNFWDRMSKLNAEDQIKEKKKSKTETGQKIK